MSSPFRYFKTSLAIVRLAVMMYVRFPLSPRNAEDLLRERRIDPGFRRGGRSPSGVSFWLHEPVRRDFRDWFAFV